MKFKTVREGECAILFDRQGQGRKIVGPERVFLCFDRLEKLKHISANQDEYLAVTENTGRTYNLPGPCEIFMNPLEHSRIKLEQAIKVDGNHMLVVYKRNHDGSVERRIIDGPTVFIPAAEEWLHQFVWHGPHPDDKTRIVPGMQIFTHLTMIPDQFYDNVKEVRTLDDIRLTVKLMIFYELKDILKMLETTKDPIADMINALCSDVIAFAGRVTFAQFLAGTAELGKLVTYPQLTQRAESIGYDISKVVYRGYHASEMLQSMQDKAIEGRTKLKLDLELEMQKQKLYQFKLEKEKARTELKQGMEVSKQIHSHNVSVMKQSHQLNLQEMEHNTKIGMTEIEASTKLECEQARKEHKADHLTRLKDLDIDLTQYLVNQSAWPVHEAIQMT